MDKTRKRYNDILSLLSKKLEARYVAARLTPTEKTDVLTVKLPKDLNGKEIFADIFFIPAETEEEAVSLFTIRAEVADLSGVKAEEFAGFFLRIAEVNDTLPLGGYGVSAEEGEPKLKTLMYRVSVPATPTLDEERMAELVDSTLTMAANIIYATVPEVLEGETRGTITSE